MKQVFKTVSRLLLCGMVAFSISACDKKNDPKPDEGDKTEVVPTDPETPETPENPDSPETPETPENPQEPETPENPQEPETPEEPNTPEEPQEPDNSVTEGEWIDLGVSVKWASCNIGANAPEEYGDYYAWGETSTKSDYSSSNSTTYYKSLTTLKSKRIVDANGNLTANYEVARKLGKGRMPTQTEFRELIEKCTFEWITLNGVNGRKVTGPNGNSIFLPAAGAHCGSSIEDVGSYGGYWSSTAYDSSVGSYNLSFGSGNYECDYNRRYDGQPIRPVMDK